MTTIEYIQKLEESLKFLPKKERQSLVKVYQNRINNYLDQGYTDDKIIKSLPSIETITKDAYDSKGIDFVKKRKEQIKNKMILDAIISIVVILVVSIATVFIVYLLGKHIYQMCSTIKAFLSLPTFDSVMMVSFIIVYFLIIAIVIMYILDLAWLIDSFMLQSVFKLFKKDFTDYKASSFFITSWFDEVTKKKYFIGRIFGILAAVMLIIGISSYATKSYMYNALSGVNSDSYHQEVELNDQVQNIILNFDEIDLEIIEGEKNTISYDATLDHHFKLLQENNSATIQLDTKYTFDVLSILKEPTPKVTIKLTKDLADKFNINFKSLKTNVSIKNISLNDFVLDHAIDGNYYIENVNIKNQFSINSDQMDMHVKASTFNDMKFIGKKGYAIFENNVSNNFSFKNSQIKIGIDTLTASNVEIENELGIVEVINPCGGKWSYAGYGGTYSVNKKNDLDYFELEEMRVVTTNASNVSIIDGIIKNGINMSLDRGNLSFVRLTADIKIEKSNGILDLIDIIGNINVTSLSGELSINSTIIKDSSAVIENEKYFNGLNSVVVKTKNTQTYIGQLDVYDLDLNVEGGTVVLNEVYGTTIDIIIDGGKVQYNNTVRANQLHNIETLNIKKNSGTYALELVIAERGTY